MSEDLGYLLSVLMTLAAYAVGFWLVWQAVEGVYWVYCKLTGRDY
jgi:fucose permease